ncbi:MAG: protein kinase [Chloroflexi bacterium]|nr:protein kinase [Chloroflexota bacterium]
MEGLIGTVLENTYRIDALLGQGGMGAVFRGQDLALNRAVAVKVMHSHVAQQQGFRERFMQEARAIAALDHPGIVQIYAFSRDPNLLYIVMAFIAGQTLQDWLHLLRERGMVLALPESLAIVEQVAGALGYAHTRGVFHRDIKPGNIILRPLEPGQNDPAGLGFHPMLTDFGLAKLSEGGILSMPGTSMGTPAYMAPEQCEGTDIDGRSDIYALGVVLYEMVTGRLPFEVHSLTEAIRAHTKEPPPPPRSIDPDVPSSVEEIILKAMAKAPSERYQNAVEMRAAITRARGSLAAEPAGTLTSATAPQASLATMVAKEEPPPTPEKDRWPTPPSDIKPGAQIVILQENGTTRSFPVGTRRRITVGRDPDCDIRLEDSQISRHHAQVSVAGDRFQITDLNSTNGTWMGDNRVLPGVAEPWRPTQTVRLGNHWLRLQGVSGAPGAPAEPPVGAATYAPRAPADMADPIQVTLEPSSQRIRTGTPAVLTIRLLNRQQQVDHLTPTVEGIPAEWVTIPSEPLRLAPGDAGTMTVRILAPRAPQSRAGDHVFSVRVYSQSQPAQSVAATGTLSIEPYREVSLALTPRSIVNAGRARVTVSNAGNADESVILTVEDPDQALAQSAPSSPLAMPPGAQKDVSLPISMRAKRPLMGSAESHTFAIGAQVAGEQIATTPGSLQIKPVFPTWAIPLFTTLAILVCAALALAYSTMQKDKAATATAQALAIVNATQTAETQSERGQTEVAQSQATEMNMTLGAQVTADAKTATAEAKTEAAQIAATHDAALAAMQATADAAGTAAAIANQPSPTTEPSWTPTLTATPSPFFGPSEARGFTIPGVYVGAYKEVCLQHDNTGPSPDWYVYQVLVAGESGYVPFVFDRWIASDKGDGSLLACSVLPTPTPTPTKPPTKTPTPAGPTPTFSTGLLLQMPNLGIIWEALPMGTLAPAMRTYDVLVVTGDVPDAGTSAVVRIRLVGQSASTDWVLLNE